jgi:isochorismate synthase
MSAARPDRGATRLAALVAQARERARASRRSVLVSLAEPVRTTDPLDVLEALAREAAFDGVLAAHLAAGRMYWTRPVDRFALAGIGAVVTLRASGPGRFAEIDRAWAALRDGAAIDDPSGGAAGVGPVLMGGFAFEPHGPRSAAWDGFPSALLTLPRLQVTLVEGECWVTTTLRVHADGRSDAAPAELARLRALALELPARETRDVEDAPDAALAFAEDRPASEWRALVGSAVTAIRADAMRKVVLARSVHVATPRALDVPAVLRQLRDAYPECRVFGCWRGDRAFVGASPERLVRLDGHEVRASSLAGSIRRGATREEDATLAARLLASPKDRGEHELVRRALCDGLAELCDDVTAPSVPSVLTLPHVHHLHTPVRARLRAGHSLLDLVARLHPTPAVGGTPRAEALRFIREHEQLDRGWYAAPVGWIGGDSGELAVALRSALIAGNEARLYVGCGIVGDSDPASEYRESLLKLRPMQRALSAAAADGAAGPSHAVASGDGTR